MWKRVPVAEDSVVFIFWLQFLRAASCARFAAYLFDLLGLALLISSYLTYFAKLLPQRTSEPMWLNLIC